MPVKFSDLTPKLATESSYLIGLYNDSNVVPSLQNNCKILTSQFAKQADFNTLNQSAVKLSGDQTITGAKTFSSTISSTVQGNSVPGNSFVVLSTQAVDRYADLVGLYDSLNNCRCATVRGFNTPVKHGILIGANSFTNSSPAGIEVAYDTNGTLTATAPTPSTIDNSTKIATTAYVKNQNYAVLPTQMGHTDAVLETDGSNTSWVDTNPCAVVIQSKKPTTLDPTWYRVWSDGWVEQGGKIRGTTTALKTISLPIEMLDTNYFVCATPEYTGTNSSSDVISSNTSYQKTTTTLYIYTTTNTSWNTYWEVKGYKAE